MDKKINISNGAVRKVLKVLNVVITTIFIVLCALCIFASISAKKSKDGGFVVFGYQLRSVLTQSMEWQEGLQLSDLKLETEEITSLDALEIKEIPRNSLIFIQQAPTENAEEWYANLKVGDVLTFMYGEYGIVNGAQPVITHRITKITPKANGKGFILELRGDNKGITSETQSSVADTATQYIDTTSEGINYAIGKVVGQSTLFGGLLHIIKQPIGTIFVIIVPCAAIIVMEIIRIVGVVTEHRKKRERAEQERKDNEIEALKRQLLELQNMQAGEAANKNQTPESEN